MTTPTVSILVPVLARPSAAAPLVESVRASSILPVEVVFLASPGDTAEIEAAEETGCRVVVVDWPPGPGDYARKINHGHAVTDGEWIFTGADDLRFHDAWEIRALALARKTGADVVGTNDLGNPAVKAGRHSTHTLVRRSYVDSVGATYLDGPGVVLHEGYRHQFVDTELVAAARARGVWAFAGDVHVEHLHPFWHKGTMDDTYRKALADGREDGRAFKARSDEFRRQQRGARR